MNFWSCDYTSIFVAGYLRTHDKSRNCWPLAPPVFRHLSTRTPFFAQTPRSNLLRCWQTRTQCCRHIVAHDCFYATQTRKHLLRTQNVSERNQKHFCVSDTTFVSATANVARAGKRGNICVRNNVSRVFVPYSASSTKRATLERSVAGLEI